MDSCCGPREESQPPCAVRVPAAATLPTPRRGHPHLQNRLPFEVNLMLDGGLELLSAMDDKGAR